MVAAQLHKALVEGVGDHVVAGSLRDDPQRRVGAASSEMPSRSITTPMAWAMMCRFCNVPTDQTRCDLPVVGPPGVGACPTQRRASRRPLSVSIGV
jgi:hypothetical protein